MPEQVPEKPLDKLCRLVNGKPTATEFEALGGHFDPHLHFVALLPSAALPAAESENVRKYFDTMLEALEPVRDAIAAYCLQGVMSRAPMSDFSFKVQFADPNIAGRVLKTLPRELASSAAPLNGLRASAESRSPEPPEAGGSMFSRKKHQEQSSEQPSGDVLPSPEAAATPVTTAQEELIRVLTSVEPALPATMAQPLPQTSVPQPLPQTIVPQSLPQTAVRAPMDVSAPARKRLLIAEDVTIRGDILGCEHLAIAGEANSTIERCGRLEVLENGIFKGSATVADAEISGYCEGTLVVRNTLYIRATGHIVGSVQCGCLQVEEGGRIQGEMKMSLNADSQTSPEPKAQPGNPQWVGASANALARSEGFAAESAYSVAKV